MIDLNEGDYVLGVWTSPLTAGWDWVACVVRPVGSHDFELRYRHRHGEVDDPFVRGNDGTPWIRVKLEGSDEPSLLAAVDRFLSENGPRRTERVLIRGDSHAMKAALAGRSWTKGGPSEHVVL